MLAKILEILSTAMGPRLDSLYDLARQVWKTNISSVEQLERMGQQCPPPDLRYTWLQEPVRLEDPLGRYIPIPSEYSFGMMEVVIVERCKAGPGARKIAKGQYQISNARNSNQIISKSRFTGLIPGLQLRMAVFMYEVDTQTGRCPVLMCGSSNVIRQRGRGQDMVCLIHFVRATLSTRLTTKSDVCKIWFSPESKESERGKDTNSSENVGDTPVSDLRDQSDSEPRPRKRKFSADNMHHRQEPEDDMTLFKNIRLREKVGEGNKVLQNLKNRFSALNFDTIAKALQRCNGDINLTTTFLHEAISSYEASTNDMATFAETRKATLPMTNAA